MCICNDDNRDMTDDETRAMLDSDEFWALITPRQAGEIWIACNKRLAELEARDAALEIEARLLREELAKMRAEAH